MTLTPRELEGLRHLFCQSPGLWPFSIVMAEAGIAGAVAACLDPSTIPAAARATLRRARYDPSRCLPTAGDAEALILGVRVQARWSITKKDCTRPLKLVARDLGVTVKQAQDALKLLNAHAATPGVRRALNQGAAEAIGQ